MRHFILVWLVVISTTMAAQTTSEKSKHFNLENGLALQGYDPVAYFVSNQATKGNPKWSSSFQGATYYFVSETNKNRFLKNPLSYEPQYGGWCAFAMGDYGKKVAIDPETFKIVEAKLYLFYNAYFKNTLKSWNKDEKNLKSKADKNWLNTIKS